MGQTKSIGQVTSTNTWLDSLPCSAETIPDGKRDAIVFLLAKLTTVYWRPDFTPGQVKQLYGQYIEDLGEFSVADIDTAIRVYRRSPETFFPTPGQLRALIVTPPRWWVSGPISWMAEVRGNAQKEAAQIARAAPVRQIASSQA